MEKAHIHGHNQQWYVSPERNKKTSWKTFIKAHLGEIAAADFFVGFFETALGPDEILTEIRVPKTGAAGTAYLKFHHRAIDWATVGVAVVVESQNGSISSARVALPLIHV